MQYIGGPLQTEDFLIPARDPGVQLFVRNKFANDKTVFTGDRTLLFVHGATYPGEATFDLRVDGHSWMEYLAERGYDVYLVNVRGYGRSSRPPAMSRPADANPPFAATEEAVRDIEAAVEFILMRRGITRLGLMDGRGGRQPPRSLPLAIPTRSRSSCWLRPFGHRRPVLARPQCPPLPIGR